MTEQFISEPITPQTGSMNAAVLASGAPDAPRRFQWRSQTIEVAEVIETWKESGPCHHGSGEMYLRKHWFRVRTVDGRVMTLYFQRQPARGGSKQRWWLYSLETAAP